MPQISKKQVLEALQSDSYAYRQQDIHEYIFNLTDIDTFIEISKISPQAFDYYSNKAKNFIIEAANTGNTKAYSALIEQVPRSGSIRNLDLINTKDEKGNTALMLAAMKGDLQMLEHILQNTPSEDFLLVLGARNKSGYEALNLAKNDEAKALINQYTEKHLETFKNYKELSNIILKVINNNLISHALHGETQAFQIWMNSIPAKNFLQCMNYTTKQGNTPLLIACKYGNIDVVESIVKSIPIENLSEVLMLQNKDGKTALDLASTDEIRELLENTIRENALEGEFKGESKLTKEQIENLFQSFISEKFIENPNTSEAVKYSYQLIRKDNPKDEGILWEAFSNHIGNDTIIEIDKVTKQQIIDNNIGIIEQFAQEKTNMLESIVADVAKKYQDGDKLSASIMAHEINEKLEKEGLITSENKISNLEGFCKEFLKEPSKGIGKLIDKIKAVLGFHRDIEEAQALLNENIQKDIAR